MAIRFLLDEHMSPSITAGLRRRGVEAIAIAEAAMEGTADPDVLDFANRSGYVVVTNDQDYLTLAASGIQHAGIVYSHQYALSVGEIIRFLLLLHRCYEADEVANRVEYMFA